MKDYKIPVIAAVVFLGYFAFNEYQQFKIGVTSTRQSVTDLLAETKATVSSVNDAIDQLKKRLFRMEETLQQQAASENAEQLNLGLMKSNLEQVATEAESLRAENQLLSKRAIEAEQSLQLIRDSPVAKVKQQVKMHSGKNCLPCAQWKQQQKPLWEAMGWQVEVIEETTTQKPWPWFEICDGDKCYEFAGGVTLEALARLKAKK